MDIGIHGIKRIMVDKVHPITGMRTYTCVLHLITASGRVDINLFADRAAKLNIVQVVDINDFYEPEPAA